MERSRVAVGGAWQIGDRIRHARRSSKLSQADLATRVGVTSSAVAQWEHPRGTCPTLTRLRAVAVATSANFEWLATGDGPQRLSPFQNNEKPALTLDLSAQDYAEVTLLKHFRALAPRARSVLATLLRELAVERG